MASAHIVEVGDRAAGIVVRGHGGFRFFALDLVFYPLEGVVCGRGRDPTLSGPVVLAGQRDVPPAPGRDMGKPVYTGASAAAIRTIDRFF
jgi:hypothetical protein